MIDDLVDQDLVADRQGVLHGSGRNEVRLERIGLDDQREGECDHDQDRQLTQERAALFALCFSLGLGVAGLVLVRGAFPLLTLARRAGVRWLFAVSGLLRARGRSARRAPCTVRRDPSVTRRGGAAGGRDPAVGRRDAVVGGRLRLVPAGFRERVLYCALFVVP